MKKIILFLLLLSTTISMNGVAKSTHESLDKIVAIVNDDVVTQSELNRSLLVLKAQANPVNMSAKSSASLKKQALDHLINKKLQMQIAKQVGINITDTDVDKVVQNVANKNNMSTQTLYERINHDGMSTADYRSELREQLTIQKLQQQEVAGHITVTPEEVTRFIQSKRWENNTNKEYHLEDLVVPISDTPSANELSDTKQRALALVTQLNQNQNFQALAKNKSEDHTKLISNDLGWRKLTEIPSAFAHYVTSMRTKEVAGPIQTSNGFHIIRLAAQRSADSSVEAPNRAQVEQLLMQRKFEENAQNWVLKMRSQAFVTLMNS